MLSDPDTPCRADVAHTFGHTVPRFLRAILDRTNPRQRFALVRRRMPLPPPGRLLHARRPAFEANPLSADRGELRQIRVTIVLIRAAQASQLRERPGHLDDKSF